MTRPIIYLDIENTIIESIDNPMFLADNCKKIKAYIKAKNPRRVNIFTWGWKTGSEVNISMIQVMFEYLEIPESIRGNIYTKGVSVSEAVLMGWLNPDDYERALQPGMMAEFGLSKVSCFIPMVTNICIKDGCECILIDDLVEKYEEIKYTKGKIILINPKGPYE